MRQSALHVRAFFLLCKHFKGVMNMKERVVINNGEGSYLELDTSVSIPAQLQPQLLRIELDTITSVPRVYYNGIEITKKVHIKFDWQTNDDTLQYSPIIYIEHLAEPNRDMKTSVIEHKGKRVAYAEEE
jgi:hypothetical protein